MISEETPENPFGRERTAAEKQALLWFSRRNRGLTLAQEGEFQAWLAQNPAHGEILDELEGAYALVGQLDESSLPLAEGQSQLEAARSVPPGSARGWGRMVWLAGSLAAAAALAFGYFGAWRPDHYSASAETEVGGLRQLTLPDGSQVDLNTDTSISVAYSRHERRIRLTHGEALFVVAKNPSRPFVVEAAGAAVRAVGTAFTVRMQPASVEVLVTDGRVQVDQTGGGTLLPALPREGAWPRPGLVRDEPVLAAGERAVISFAPAASVSPEFQRTQVTSVAPDELERKLAWKKHEIDFSAAPLAEMVAEFNRYNLHQLAIGDDRLAARRYGGSFRSDDYAGFVRMLRENFGVSAEESGEVTILSLASP